MLDLREEESKSFVHVKWVKKEQIPWEEIEQQEKICCTWHFLHSTWFCDTFFSLRGPTSAREYTLPRKFKLSHHFVSAYSASESQFVNKSAMKHERKNQRGREFIILKELAKRKSFSSILTGKTVRAIECLSPFLLWHFRWRNRGISE